MAITNQDRVGRGLELLKSGLTPFVERELKSQDAQGWLDIARQSVPESQARLFDGDAEPQWDATSLLAVMWNQWNTIFRKVLGPTERSLVQELRDWRNKWAHQQPFSSDDAERALDSMSRLLTAISAPQVEDVARIRNELRRLVIDEQTRSEKRKAGASLITSSSQATLKPWREVVTPHPDVASGRYQQAEFAADLWQVHLGQGSDEYRKPEEFFRRTFLTESLKQLLVGGVRRVSGTGGDPVVQLQTNFGGGKTHSMLALYHLFSGVKPGDLVGVDAVMAEAGVTELPSARRVVLVGNKISPGNPVIKHDGTEVRTLWGELAWQLGGAQAFARLAKDDENATSPGDVLRELFVEYGPSVILIDEWVAYARQLHDASDLPAGSFETMFSFAQALTESAKLAGNCLLVVSLPASDTAGSPHTHADDVEVGGLRGREALDRLRNVVGRLESSWRPATAEEGFEIVRRRLFEPLASVAEYKLRDVTAGTFAEMYRAQSAEFPTECRSADYEQRIKAAYPIHPEIFDRLYMDWSTQPKFQRTRGVLRLMAAVIHSLWEKGDGNPLILPSTIPIDDVRVRSELTRYLSDNWAPIIEKDVDGPDSLPLRIDSDVPNLGKLQATRRVARTVYLGSAPVTSSSQRGLEDRRVKLGCAMPGESTAIFGDALRRLAAAATYLYQDGPRFWYDTQPTVTKLAEDRAELLKRDDDSVAKELERRLVADLRNPGDFAGVHTLPRSGADVPDDYGARLVVLHSDHPHSSDPASGARAAARSILESRGNAPRLYQNTLVFLAADKARLPDLEDALRKYLAWTSILSDRDTLNLDPHQVRQAEAQHASANTTVVARLPECYNWLLVPEQSTPQSEVSWNAVRLTGSGALAERASKRLRSAELLLPSLGYTILRMHMDNVPLWRGNHVAVAQLVEDFARYLYLPRLRNPEVLLQAIRAGMESLSWQLDAFAIAEAYDEQAGRYRGLRASQIVSVDAESRYLLVRPDVAEMQLDAEAEARSSGKGRVTPPDSQRAVSKDGDPAGIESSTTDVGSEDGVSERPRRYHGTVQLDAARVGRDAGRIADEVIAHLVSQLGSEVTVTLEIEARLPDGATEHIVRTVLENGRTLKFDSQGFESE